MDNPDLEKLISFDIADKLSYVSNTIVEMNIIKQINGDIKSYSFDIGMELRGKRSTTASYIRIIEGSAKIQLENQTIILQLNETMIIPAYTDFTLVAIHRFKMLSITLDLSIKSLQLHPASTESSLYKAGQTVCTKMKPGIPLVVTIYANNIYYCYQKDNTEAEQEVHFERELSPYIGLTKAVD